ncbi:MAG: amino acid ABC transporter permease, partial [Bdellovibrionales bacterium]|nr:amino acid ABC transporter permease [Oligoflexia bacterium]
MKLGPLLLFCSSFLLACPLVFANGAELRWAADAKSGAPFMFVDPSNPKKMKGFELDIMEKLAEKMGRKLQ